MEKRNHVSPSHEHSSSLGSTASGRNTTTTNRTSLRSRNGTGKRGTVASFVVPARTLSLTQSRKGGNSTRMDRSNSQQLSLESVKFPDALGVKDRLGSSFNYSAMNDTFVHLDDSVDLLQQSFKNVPRPRTPSECQLLCVFYAEFDNKVGPKVCFQSPERFLDNDITMSTTAIDKLLAKEFAAFHRTATESSAPSTLHEEQESSNSPFVAQNSLSIFDSTCEYIITGNELADRIISLSAHNIHIISRPTIINNTRYERNALLFSVGFVIRRANDPSPFRPLLSKFSSTLRLMEVETQFLSDPTTRARIPEILNGVLLSLNSVNAECNLVLNEANVLNLKLFRSPRGFVSPTIPDHVVPVLLRPEWQVQMFDWDLTIAWIVPHIDGIKHISLIAQSSSVDLEMVKASVRVLQHHGVLSLVDIFRYSNVYECTPLASHMLAGHQPKLLNAMYQFTLNTMQNRQSLSLDAFRGDSLGQHSFTSPESQRPIAPIVALTSGVMKSNNADEHMIKVALAILYCSCQRNVSFGDILISKIISMKNHSHEKAEYCTGSEMLSTSSTNTLSSDEDKIDEQENINWLNVLEAFDHRRFITFGVIFGLIRRIHEYPFVSTIDQGNIDESLSTNDLPLRVAALMDGTRSDDDLSSIFHRSYKSLLSLVETQGNSEVFICHAIT